MTHTDVALHWTTEHQWTAVVLALVPTPDLPVPAEALAAAAFTTVRSDVIAFDLVTVGAGPIVDGSPERDDEVAAALLRLAAAPGYLVGPRAILACVVVGGANGSVESAADRLSRHPRLRRLGAVIHREVVTGLAQGVHAIGRLVSVLVETAEGRSAAALDEARFLAELAAPEPPAAAPEPAPAAPEPVPAAPGPRPAAPDQWRAAPLLVHRAETGRPPLWRRRAGRGDGTPVLTEPYWLDHLAASASSAALAQLILVPDYESPSKAVTLRRRALALALDEALGRVYRHPTGRDLNVAVELLVATSPLTRCTPLRPAGVLAAAELPTVPLDYFDLYDVADELGEARQRASRALTRRRVDVTSAHLIVLSTTAPLYHEEAAERFAELVRHTRLTWLHLGPGETLPDEFTQDCADRVARYRDHADIVSEVMSDVEDLYGVPAPPFDGDEDEDEDDEAAPEPPA